MENIFNIEANTSKKNIHVLRPPLRIAHKKEHAIKTKRLKIGTLARKDNSLHGYNFTPFLVLQGKVLNQIGLQSNTYVNVEYYKGKIIINLEGKGADNE